MSERVRRRALAIVGAGPHGLTLALRAVDAGLRPGVDLEVIDPSGAWLAEWRLRFAAHAISRLRSPGSHHPGADHGGLRSFAEANGTPSTTAWGQPATAVFNRYCERLAADAGLATAVTPARAHLLAADAESVTILCTDDVVIDAARAVLATNPGRRRIPSWVGDLLPMPIDVLAHAADVDLRGLELAGETVTVVGGGLTAAQLALGARACGAERVHLVVRRRLRASTFDVDPGWLGPKHLRGFALLTPAERAEAARTARDGGSVPHATAGAIRDAVRAGEIELHEGSRVVAGRNDHGSPVVVLGDETHLRSHRLWLATGTECTVDTCRLLTDVGRCFPCDVHGGLPDLRPDLSWPGTALHLTGRLAALQLGPAAGNLWGARHAAERILPAVVATASPATAPA